MTSDLFHPNYQTVADRLRSAHRILAVTHLSPDGDALGSLLFFNLLMKKIGIETTMYCAGPMPGSLAFLANFEKIITDKNKINFNDFDVFITLDCATIERSNIAPQLINRLENQFFIEIDHHPATNTISDLALRIVEAASTTQILFHLAQAMKVEIDQTMATALMTGIITDTASFIHPSATDKTIKASAEIVASGANLSKINDQTSKTKTMASLRLWGKALSRLTHNEKYNIVYTIITKEDIEDSGNDEDAIEGIAGFLAGIEKAAAIIVLREDNGEIRGSMRTIRDNVDLNRLARALGGGGHRRASGFKFPGRLVCENGNWQVKYK